MAKVKQKRVAKKKTSARPPVKSKNTKAKNTKAKQAPEHHHSASRHASRVRAASAAKRAAMRGIPFELRESAIQGTGAFATRRIKKGERIIEYTGEKITHDIADLRYDDEGMGRHHTFLFTLDDDTVVDGASGGNESRFINHSCDPNCEAIIERRRIFIYAKRPIQPGEELTYDYAYEWTDEHTQADLDLYVCKCGSANCRGTIMKKA